MIDELPILGICGGSGAGKTALIEAVLPRLRETGLAVAVVKHAAHGVAVDRPGADSDRLFRAGADVLLEGPEQELFRRHRTDTGEELTSALQSLAAAHDLVLVEGHKAAPLPKVWLLNEGESAAPAEVENIVAVLAGDEDRPAALMGILEDHVAAAWRNVPVFGCVLIGGKSKRMGMPKHLLRRGGTTWLERTVGLLRPFCRTVVIAGAGEIPEVPAGCARLPDARGVEGPMAGILAAMRWAPHVSWLVAACDLPGLSAAALEWLVSTRRPGAWATLPRLEGSSRGEPLLAHYDFRCRGMLEALARKGSFRVRDVADHPKVISPVVPPRLAAAWRNVNTPAELDPASHPDVPPDA